jgi:hypothetical protein
MKSKNKGEAAILLVIVVLVFTIVATASLLTKTLDMQQVQELTSKCKQQQGEALLVLNSRNNVKKVQCKKQGAVYDKF